MSKILIEGDFLDTVKSSSDLRITWLFADGDTRTMTVKNPKSDISAADLNAFATSTINNNVIIGDKSGAAVSSLKSAVVTNKSDFFLDLS